MKFHLAMLAAIALTLGSLAALHASSGDSGGYPDIELSNPWSRATPAGAMTGAGFVIITNKGPGDDRLVSASSPIASRAELHETKVRDDVMTMRERSDGIVIPAGETIALKPGGLHIMFVGLAKPLVEGLSVPVTLTFEHAGTITLDFDVLGMGGNTSTRGHEHSLHRGHGHDKAGHE